MKRFLVFAGDTYYPSGGWEDLLGQADTHEEARAIVEGYESAPTRRYTPYLDWAHVVDAELGQTVAHWGYPLHGGERRWL